VSPTDYVAGRVRWDGDTGEGGGNRGGGGERGGGGGEGGGDARVRAVGCWGLEGETGGETGN